MATSSAAQKAQNVLQTNMNIHQGHMTTDAKQTTEKLSISTASIKNRWKTSDNTNNIFIFSDDFITPTQALFNATYAGDIEGVKEALAQGAVADKAYHERIPREFEIKLSVYTGEDDSGEEDYVTIGRHHHALIAAVDNDRTEIVQLLFAGGALPSRATSRQSLGHGLTLVWFAARGTYSGIHTLSKDIVLMEIRCIAEARYFSATGDAAIGNTVLYKRFAERASNFTSAYGITRQIEGIREHDPHGTRLAMNEAVLKAWKEIVEEPIMTRNHNAVEDDVYEPYTTLFNVIGQTSAIPKDILVIMADYFYNTFNPRFHEAFHSMHTRRFDAIKENPRDKSLTIAWHKFNNAVLPVDAFANASAKGTTAATGNEGNNATATTAKNTISKATAK